MSKQKAVQHGHLQHWRHYYRRRRQFSGINSRSVAAGQILSIASSVIAGLLIELNKFEIAAIAGAFIILPGIFDLTTSLAASLSAKVNHQLAASKRNSASIIIKNTLVSILLATFSGAIVASLGAAAAVLFFEGSFMQIFLLTELTVVLCAVIGFPLAGLISLLLNEKGINPDDTVGPIETSFFEIVSIIALVIVIGWQL